ncbi:MAG: 30S ribosomal protein S12 methylthiotransferase RimO [Dermatophilaceae bacterium]
MPQLPRGRVALVTLGCSRNEVDSEELAGRLTADGWHVVDDAAEADVALVNTCGFVAAAKKDSIDTLLEASELKTGRTQAVVAVGCLAERYGQTLADALPEADAVLGFDAYPQLSAHLQTLLGGGTVPSHRPRDRRRLLPLTPVARQDAVADLALPGHASGRVAHDGAGPAYQPAGTGVVRERLDARPWAPLKIASGCDRRCAFCAIPAFRGSFVSRPPADILAEARWLAERGVRELFLVSENSTSYGKDLGDPAALERLLPRLAALDGVARVRVSYLQPAEIRPGLLAVLAQTDGVAPYFDISFQHASGALLRRMRRFGEGATFLELLERVRSLAPEAGVRSNVIVGFPGETHEDLQALEQFLQQARLDVVGVFGYSDEDGTEAAAMDGQRDAECIADRVSRVAGLVEELTAQRAEERVGERAHVLMEGMESGRLVGRSDAQGPDVDGVCLLDATVWQESGAGLPRVGDVVEARVAATEGVDLLVVPQ